MRLEKMDLEAYHSFAEALRPIDPYLRPPHLREFHNPGPGRFLGRFKPLWMPLLYCEEFVSEGCRLLLLEVAEIEVALDAGRLAHLRVRADEHLATQDLPAEGGTLKALRVPQSRHYVLVPPEGSLWYEDATTDPAAAGSRIAAMKVERLELDGRAIPVPELIERLRVYEGHVRADSIELEPLEMEREHPLEFVLKRESTKIRRMAEEAK